MNLYIIDAPLLFHFLFLQSMKEEQANNPLHGITLEAILQHLVKLYGWEELGQMIRINCFNENPSVSSSLKFLRTTSWARLKVENLYLKSIDK